MIKTRIITALIFVLLLSLLTLGIVLDLRPSVKAYGSYLFHQKESPRDTSLRVTFMGVSTLLFDDGETAWMTDGFFTRPGITKVLLGRLDSNVDVVTSTLEKMNVKKLAAVIPVHSHYDHALDSALVAKLTDAVLTGSPSTANIGKGFGLPDSQIQTIQPNQILQIGKFKITFILSAHSPDAFYPGEISHPLNVPAKASEYQMGECYTLLVEHEGKSLLVQGSAGFVPGALQNIKADVIYLGIGLLGKQPGIFRENYWNEVVQATGVKRALVIHWDDFFKPLEHPLVPFPFIMDNLKITMDDFIDRGRQDSVEIRIPPIGESLDPFEGLARP